MYRGGHEFIDRDRNIYYDTDNIHEHQKETIRVCNDCGGALKIDSAARGGKHILAVHLPKTACQACRDQGHRWYRDADTTRYHKVYLQDRHADLIEEKTE
jgi:hypothetical protein